MCSSFSIHDAVAYLEENDELGREIFIEPPDFRIESEEDSGDDETGGTINNLSGRQLRAGAELVLMNMERIGVDPEYLPDADNSSNGDPVPVKKFKRTVREKVKWIKEDLQVSTSCFPDANYLLYRGKTPLEIFELFFTDDMYSFLIEQSMIYTQSQNKPIPMISADEIRTFIGVLLLSGYNRLPGIKRYWDQELDMKNGMVVNAIRRDRFLQISRAIHCADNSKLDPKDKLAKLRPLIEHVRNSIQLHFQPEQCLGYDESMIAYYGHHGCKQFIRGKPIRFGYKAWCLNTPSGYLVDFEIYQGKSITGNDEYEVEFGKAAAPLVTMIDNLEIAKGHLPYHLYFDNLFTSIYLLNHLKSRGLHGTGTVRENRMPKECPLTSTKAMKKMDRGAHDYQKSEKEGVIIARWKDNSVVTVMSTCHSVMPLTRTKRYSSAQKMIVQIGRPSLIAKYNEFMGGTDLMDENIARHRINVKGKKWWWPIFTWLVDVCLNNAWVVCKRSGADITKLQFTRSVVQTYLTRSINLPKYVGRPSKNIASSTGNRISNDIRYDGYGHLVASTNGSRRRCAHEVCKSQGRTMCIKCNVGLCVSCFVDFHTVRY